MLANVDRLMQGGCATEKSEKLCRARGGESCAFDGAMIVLQPIADAAHIIHGPIACCGSSWEGRGTLSSRVGANGRTPLHKWGFTTDMSELDIVYGSEEKLYRAIVKTNEEVHPRAIFVHATCVSGLIGEDIEAVCKKAESSIGIRVIPVNAPGFVGPKNLGNRIAGEVLLEHVIGTGEPPRITSADINLIGEYNIAGDLWLVEPVLRKAGINILSRITGDSTFDEITYAHRAKLNVVVCSRALINVAKEMERKYGIPYVEVSFFGKTEMSKALRAICKGVSPYAPTAVEAIEQVIASEENILDEKLRKYANLRGKKAVLYTGGVKSWSFISALLDLGIEIVAVGTKKSTFEDEEKMREILGPDAPLVEDVTPKNLLKLLREKKADMLVAGGRNKYLAVKEGYPFIDVNQERHKPYAGYEGLVNIAADLSAGLRFYANSSGTSSETCATGADKRIASDVLINPLKNSQAIGAAIAFQGINKAVPVLHGAQGCNFLGKVLITNHFREPIALVSSKLFVENVVMGSEENAVRAAEQVIDKSGPDVVGILTTGLAEVKGDDLAGAIKMIDKGATEIVHVKTPDYEGGLETGYSKAVEAIIRTIVVKGTGAQKKSGQVNIIAGPHLTPADFTELREMAESFGLRPVIVPDLAALDGSRKGMSALALGGAPVENIRSMADSEFTIAIGSSMQGAAEILKGEFGIEFRVFERIAGLQDTDRLMETLSALSGREMPARYERRRHILIDGMRDAQFYFANKRACIALDPDHSVQMSRLLAETGITITQAVVPHIAEAVSCIMADETEVGDLNSIRAGCDIIISNSHAEESALRLKVPLYQTGFPVHKLIGVTARVTIGYTGTLNSINDIGNLLMKAH
ncbi:MAG TPA: nitrogenase iron-molybdenum cofactor biosynthesis protein NifE [Dissulfurispiraceae bacterium]|nr:nitrogenase iron-molybdenum cofactor biosynthesis protein NifE [Dissulfurispiraceae bacterium]